MSDRKAYQGFIIEAMPDKLVGDGAWTTHLFIERHDDSGITVREYSAKNTFPTRDEALAHCYTFGRQVIDGQVKGCTPP